MPVYNSERHVREAVDSILRQTFTNFELILIEDGSTDDTRSILNDYSRQDSRVVLVENGSHEGLVYSLNRGLAASRGKYIARMDADDVSLPDRFTLQVSYMEQHPEVGVLDANIVYIDVAGRALNRGRPRFSHPESPNVIRWTLLWKCPINHPAVLMRRSVLEEGGITYDPSYRDAEDREIFVQLGRRTLIARLPEVALQYRLVPTSISRGRSSEQRAMDHMITRREVTTLLGTVTSKEGLETLISVFTRLDQNANRDFAAAEDILIAVYRRFLEQPLSDSDREQIQADVADRLIAVAKEATSYSPKLARSLLWRLRYLPMMHLFSVGAATRILKVVLNSFGIRRRATRGG